MIRQLYDVKNLEIRVMMDYIQTDDWGRQSLASTIRNSWRPDSFKIPHLDKLCQVLWLNTHTCSTWMGKYSYWRKKLLLTVLPKKSAIVDLVCMRTKLLKWSAFRPHFTQKVSLSHFERKVVVKLWKRKREVSIRLRTRVRDWGHASPG